MKLKLNLYWIIGILIFLIVGTMGLYKYDLLPESIKMATLATFPGDYAVQKIVYPYFYDFDITSKSEDYIRLSEGVNLTNVDKAILKINGCGIDGKITFEDRKDFPFVSRSCENLFYRDGGSGDAYQHYQDVQVDMPIEELSSYQIPYSYNIKGVVNKVILTIQEEVLCTRSSQCGSVILVNGKRTSPSCNQIQHICEVEYEGEYQKLNDVITEKQTKSGEKVKDVIPPKESYTALFWVLITIVGLSAILITLIKKRIIIINR